jgi:putative oxidoreductase
MPSQSTTTPAAPDSLPGRLAAANQDAILFVIVATGISHRFWDFAEAAARRAQESQFFKNLSIMGGFILLFAAGPGRFSLDGWLASRRRSRTPDPLR